MQHPNCGAPLDADLAAQIRSLVARVGERRAVQTLGVSRECLARALAGLGLRRGTALLIRVNAAPALGLAAPAGICSNPIARAR